ncbi:protein kinase [Maudiozyma humilis]|uniref:non-specific serine/threonine protein kinase n=1 Tax=Maudiozyma humilis TaxID=51915 RepID=A0AAV5S2P5_MAUHU|nr:protein kinase [Kazachstania humilis]
MDMSRQRKRTAADFVFKEELGHGSYSTVYKAVDKRDPKRVYAIKVCSKAHIIKERKVKYVTIEKNTMNLLAQGNHPGIVKLYYTFHDADNLYFALDFASGGELLALLHRYGRFNDALCRHFTAQLVDTLEYIHSRGVIHRDLKPENVLLDRDGRLMITDFGAAATTDKTDNPIDDDFTPASSFVGTAEYVSPELLLHNRCTPSSDIWALGCMIYQFTVGSPPFRGENELKTFAKIVELDYTWNPSRYDMDKSNTSINPMIVDTVRRILVTDDATRITLAQLKLLPWFQDLDWKDKGKIWQGVFTMVPSLLDRVPSPASQQAQLRQGPSRQLHVIDTPVKNITIMKQKTKTKRLMAKKNKKPTKMSENTNSIVEWRRKLGISLSHESSTGGNERTPATGIMQSPEQKNNAMFINAAAQRAVQMPLAGLGVDTNTHRMRPRAATQPAPVVSPPSLAQQQPQVSPPPPPPQPIASAPPLPTSQVQTNPAPSPPLPLKQDFIYIYEIPYHAVGPALALSSYNKIDNNLITEIVAKHESVLKCTGTRPKLLTISEAGKLAYSDDVAGSNRHGIVDVSDSDLSMYDFEFDEAARSGFLILEKYKEKIWFISLAPSVVVSQLCGGGAMGGSSPVINHSENWVDCFFRARQMLDDKQLQSGVRRLSVQDGESESSEPGEHSDENMYNHTSTSFVNSAPEPMPLAVPEPESVLPPSVPTSVLPPLPAAKNTPPVKHTPPASASPVKRVAARTTTATPVYGKSSNTIASGKRTKSSPMLQQTAQQQNNDATIASKSALLHYLAKEPVAAPHPRRKTSVDERRAHIRSPKPARRVPSSPLPAPAAKNPVERKYTPPKHMIVTSSRYEVLDTLNSSNQRVGSDHAIASSGASAAFNRQRQRNDSREK